MFFNHNVHKGSRQLCCPDRRYFRQEYLSCRQAWRSGQTMLHKRHKEKHQLIDVSWYITNEIFPKARPLALLLR
ncbi:MAG: hypothetical protein FWD31_00325 [Planctomycetaceae bacterium]|nr:hypothetical protein [Planctomycetaceae bacterium]